MLHDRPVLLAANLSRATLPALLLIAACGTSGGGGEAGSTSAATTAGTTQAPTSTSTSATGAGSGESGGVVTGSGGSSSTGDAGESTGEGSTGSTGEPFPVDAVCAPWAVPAGPQDQSVVPVEVLPNNPAATRVVLVAGAPSLDHPSGAHEFFAGTAILAKLLCQTPGVVPVIVRNGWPADESVFVGASAVVFYLDGRDAHPLADPAKYAVLKPVIEAGAGFVNLHYAVDYNPAVGAQILPWLGGHYEDGYSVNPIWQATYADLPAHAVANGVAPFTVNDEWYYNMRWIEGMPGVTAILQSVPPDSTRTTPDTQAHPGRSEITAWTFDRPDGGRGFGLTGGHWHGNWTDSVDAPDAAKLRRVVVNGILWAAKVDVPAEGAPVELDPADGGRWLDSK